MSDASVLLACSHVGIQVREKTLLENVSFTLRRGENRAIVGPNGAGKTTLLRSILGGVQIGHGEIQLGGRELAGLARREIAKSIAYVPQLLAEKIPYTVREFVAMGRYAYGDGAMSLEVERALDDVGMINLAERVVSTLSGGERQRVCIAAALAQQAPILLLDEPLAHLDPEQRMEVQATLSHLNQEVTLLVVTHDLAWARRDFKSLLALKNGKMDFDGSVSDFFQGGGVSRLFGEAVGYQYRDHL